jgi:hypothetical protein
MSHLSQSLLVCTISAISYKISVCDPIPGWHLWYSGCQLSIPLWLYQNIYELSIGLMLINVHIPVSVAIIQVIYHSGIVHFPLHQYNPT